MKELNIEQKQDNTAPQQSAGPRVILPAEKKFNNRLYWGLNYAIQVSTAVAGSYWIKFGGGKKYFDKAAQWAGEHIIPKVTNKRGAEAIKETNTYLIGATQLMIGNLFFIPIKWFENKKPEYVRRIDEAMLVQQEKDGLPVTPEQRRHHEEALQALEKEPKASWPTLAAARIAGISSFFVSNWIIGENRSKWMQTKTAEGVQSALKHSGLKPLEKLGHSPKVKNFAELAFIDFFYSIFVANTVFQVTKFLTPLQKRKDELVTQQPEQPTETQPMHENAPAKFAEKERQKKTVEIKPSNAHKKFTDYVQSSNTEPQVSV
ncbi:MAG: hypothetical protein AB7L92_05250 [Alphaproteobacteria bacterium]